MNTDLRHDWQVLDNMEDLIVRSRRTTGDFADYKVSSKRRALGFKEFVASGGVYTAQDLIWLIPAELVTVGPIKPADILEPIDGQRWTVLEAPLIAEESYYKCICRNLVIANDLRDLIDIWEATNTQDAQANRTPTFAALHSKIPGRIQPIAGTIENTLGKFGLTKTYIAFLATQLTATQQLEITNEMQLRINGQTSPKYAIKGWRNPARIDQLFEIDLEVLP